MDTAGLLASQARLTSVAQRHLSSKHGSGVTTLRGDGLVLFTLPPLTPGSTEGSAEGERLLTEEVQLLCTALVRELVGQSRVRLAGEDNESDFASLKSLARPFVDFISGPSSKNVSASSGANGKPRGGPSIAPAAADMNLLIEDLNSLPGDATVARMLDMLYTDVAGDNTGLAVVNTFPTPMCPTGNRVDVVVKKAVCISAFSNTTVPLIAQEKAEECNLDLNLTATLDTVAIHERQGGAGGNGVGGESSSDDDIRGLSPRTRKKHAVTSATEPQTKILVNVRAIATALSASLSAPVESALPSQWRHKSFSLPEASEVLKLVHQSLRSFWNSNPHSEKTKVNALSLLSIVSGDLREYITELMQLSGSDCTGPWRVALQDLENAQALATTWIDITAKLTEGGEWVGWDGGRYTDETLYSFTARLRDTLRVRQLVRCAGQLMQTSLPDSLLPDSIFAGESVTDLTRTPNSRWMERVTAFEKEFSLLEDHLRGRVKKMLQGQTGDTLFSFLIDFGALVRRESFRTALQPELESAAAYLSQQINAAQDRYQRWKQQCDGSTGSAVSRLRAAVGCQAACAQIPERARALFGRSEYLDAIVKQAKAVVSEAQQDTQTALGEWKSAVASQCQQLNAIKEAFAVEVSSSDLLTCKVHPDVTALMREVRLVRSLTVALGPTATQLGEAEETTLKYCAELERASTRTRQAVSNFNSVCREVVPCTRPMLTTAIKYAVTQICYNSKPRIVAIGAYSELDSLNTRFHKAVEAFSNENRHIRRFHAGFVSQVAALHHVDLSRSMDQWRNIVDTMRTSFEDFLHQYHFENHEDWRRHWDSQIYKALEFQYRRGLETLHESMQEFKVELVFKQGQVQFKPTLEAMREAYYVKVREFVSVPQRFRGLQPKRQTGGLYEIYPAIPPENNARILVVYAKAVELFTKLNRVRKALRDHVVVGVCGTNGAPDLDSIVDAACTTTAGYLDGLRIVKDRQRLLAKMEDSIRVDCFTISTIPVKAAVEDQLRRLEEALLNSMRKMMQRSLSDIDDFVYGASNVVERQPTTMDEVGKANKAFYEFHDKLSSYEERFAHVADLNRILRQHGGSGVELASTKARWDHLQEAMASHHSVIDASVSKMRVSVEALIQKFFKDVQRYDTNWNKQKGLLMQAFQEGKMDRITKGLATMKEQGADLEDLKAQAKELEAKCDYFKIPPPNFSQLQETVADVEATMNMWALHDTFTERQEQLRNEDWLTFRSTVFRFEDFVKEWQETASAEKKKNKESSKNNVVIKYIQRLLGEWSGCLPLLRFIRGDGYMTEHWNEMFRLLDLKGLTSDKLTFGHILDRHTLVTEKEKELKHLHARAQGETQIREALQELRTWALDTCFSLVAPAEGIGAASKIKLISEWKDVMTQVSDNQALIGSLKDSAFFSHFADEAAGWEAKLVALSEYLVLLNSIQRKWTYLEPIFARGALPQEQPRFKRVDKEFVSILRDVEEDPRVMTLASQYDLGERLRGILEQIERCQKALNEYLEAKRNKFPRFYFVSDEDLLEILGQSRNPSVIQAHLKKLFMGIHKVHFNDEKTAITHMVSADGEEVELLHPVSITGSADVEDWLIQLDTSMRHTLQALLRNCINEGNVANAGVISMFPSQILQIAEQVLFSAQVESCITGASGGAGAYKSLLEGLRAKLSQLTGMDIRSDVVMALKVKALILDTIHSIEVVELLEREGVRDVASWWWQKQLRYYMARPNGAAPGASPNRAEDLCVVKMVDAKFDYTYEYQGNAPKLVHTPLTDKCYLVLTKGMNLGYGGNPYGPAGTGKTESVKALGSAMGRQVLVFNCDEGIDFKAMGRIFVGIVKCGAWGCFDEFNRLKIDQLSAISQMIQVIQEALKAREPSCQLLGSNVEVNPNSGIFVTLNPAGKGYGGRTKLPDNLKQLFREVAMSVPDNELITSTMLMSEGFTHARPLAKRVVELYKLCSQLLSRQQHYDWGLRPLKAVLRLGGSLVFQWKQENVGKQPTKEQEYELMVQSLNINTLSKLTFDDAMLFSGLMMDVFEGIASREISYAELEAAITSAVEALGLQQSAEQTSKVLQLYEAMNQRMGVVLVGPSGSGKSTLLRILRKSLQSMNVEVPQHVMNPKAMPRKQLLGYMDPDTREWFDGVLSAAARQVVKEPGTSRCWICCDGDIDPEWIESLNSVLDDNKLLTMPNGVRIQFGSNVNFIFETHSLEFASPATVSRMGVIYLSTEDVNPKHVMTTFMDKVSPAPQDFILPFLLKHLMPVINIATSLDALSVPTTTMGLLTAALNHTVDAVDQSDLVCSLIRGVGSALLPSAAESFAKQVFELTETSPVSAGRPLDTYVDRSSGKKMEFAAKASVEVTQEQLRGGEQPMVHTVEVQRLFRVLEPLVSHPACKPFVLVGPEGCGKALILRNCFSAMRGVRVTEINCSAQTNSQLIVQKLLQLCSSFSTPTGRVLRPKEGERLVIILKDINLPKPDKYGTVELHSFLQQLIVYSGFYDKDLEWIGVERVQIAGSMNPQPSAGRFPVTPRLLAIVNIITMAYPSKPSLLLVYSTYFSSLLKSTGMGLGKDYDNGADLAQFVMNVYEKIRRRFEGEEYAHCVFCPRNVTQWICNALMYDIEGTSLPAILAYEASRIFADCLPRPEDRSRAEKIFAEQLATIGYSVPSKEDRYATMYVSWLSDAAAPGGSKRLKLIRYEDSVAEIKNGLLKYSREQKELVVPIIPEVVSWIARVDRVLARPGGHLLLVGRPGVGRRNAVCLAAYMLRMEAVVLHMGKDYGIKNFRTDLRSFIQRAAAQNERLVLVLEDHNVVDEAFLEIVNSFVSGGGEVPGLFTPEEVDSMLAMLRDEAANDGFVGNIYTYFLRRLHTNMRIALIMDGRNTLFLPRLQANPGFLTCCDVLWMGTWSNDATRTVCKEQLRDIIAELEASTDNKGFHLHREMFAVHDGFGDSATPQHFQTFMTTYAKILRAKGKTSVDTVERLEAGLAKMKEAEESVSKIQRDVKAKKGNVEAMQKEADEALQQIQKNMEDSKEQRDSAEELQQRLQVEHKDIVEKRARVEEELGEIQPMLTAAREAVSGIRSEQLNEIRSLKAPPEPIRDVLEGVMALLGVNDTSWQSMRKFLGERGVKDQILAFDIKLVTPQIRENVARLLRQKATSFKHEVINRASIAAAPMAVWVKATVEYANIMERIAPLNRQLEQLEANQAEGEAQLAKLKKKLKLIDVAVEGLRTEFSSKCKEAEKLNEVLEKAEVELAKAQDLLDKLSGEKTRWAKDAEKIKESNRLLPKRALVAAAFITYLAKEDEAMRLKYVKQWCDRLSLPSVLSVASFLRTESQLLQFKAQGLPGDELSLENAVVMLDSIQTPLVIDPANKAMQWTKTYLQSNEIVADVASMYDERFPHTLELAIRFGKTLLVSEVDRIDPMLYPILRKDLISAGAKQVVQLGSKLVDWQDSFHIVLFSRSTDLHLSPDSSALIAAVNFSVTSKGLESQLLGQTIHHENPELEKQKVELLSKEDQLKMQLSEVEEKLLVDLASSHGNLLENTRLISSLNDVKTQAATIMQSLKQSHALQEALDAKRSVYQPLASRAADIFFLMRDMETLNRMYQFGLVDFLRLFKMTLEEGGEPSAGGRRRSRRDSSNSKSQPLPEVKQESPEEVAAKIGRISHQLAKQCYFYVSGALFKKDRLVFGMHMVRSLFPDKFPEAAWKVVVGALIGTQSSAEEGAGVPMPGWAPPTAKTRFMSIVGIGEPLLQDMLVRWKLNDDATWSAWLQESQPEETLWRRVKDLPNSAGSGDLTVMDCLLLVSTFRPDRSLALIQMVVLSLLQIDSLVELCSLEQVIADVECTTPILLITSSGADPSIEVQEVALRVVGKQRFAQVALGGGQTEHAMAALRKAVGQGDWLFLKNLHLVLDWASVLEKELGAMGKPHPFFRLLITTEPHPAFPSVLLQMSRKIAFESPPGMKQNMLRTYTTTWDEQFISSLSPLASQVLFGLAWFHAIVQERRNYIPQGWVNYYDFTQADMKSAVDIICGMTERHAGPNSPKSPPPVDWVTIRGLLSDSIYGGRLDNPRDAQVLSLFISKVFADETLVTCAAPLHHAVTVPKSNTHEVFVNKICESLGDVDSPAIFSLPENADRAVLENIAEEQFSGLRGLLQMKVAKETSKEAWRQLLEPIVLSWTNSGLEKRRQSVQGALGTSAAASDQVGVFFVNELKQLTSIIAATSSFFADLQRVVDGTLVPSDDLRADATQLLAGQVPELWLDRIDGPRKLDLWLALLRRKYDTMKRLAKGGGAALLRTEVFDLVDFLRPTTFFSSLRQTTARAAREPLVDLVLVAFLGSSDGAAKLAAPITIRGSSICVQGAVLSGNNTSLTFPSRNDLSFTSLGSMNLVLGWMPSSNLPGEGWVTVPVYSNQQRTSLLFSISAPSDSRMDKSALILGGVAAFVNTAQ